MTFVPRNPSPLRNIGLAGGGGENHFCIHLIDCVDEWVDFFNLSDIRPDKIDVRKQAAVETGAQFTQRRI